MIITDGTLYNGKYRVWCRNCAMKFFVGLEGELTFENIEAFEYNVHHGMLSNFQNGALLDANTLDQESREKLLEKECHGCRDCVEVEINPF